jgi:signal transduction histidine kinase
MSRTTLSRMFALLSLLIIGAITASQVFVESVLLRDAVVEWERTTAGDAIRAAASTILRPEDFVDWRRPETEARFADFFERALRNREILRVKLYGPDMRVVWSDEPRLRGQRFPENTRLRRALDGAVVGHLDQASKAENVYERAFAPTVELYVPLMLGPVPGQVSGVVEIYKDPARMFANIRRDYVTVIATSLASAVLLYLALYWVVRRASKQIETQRRALERQAAALAAANAELRAAQDQLRVTERLAAIGEVTATVAQGIRHPLANIRAAAQVALELRGDHQAIHRRLRAIVGEVDRIAGWLRILLDSVRPFEVRATPVDVNRIVRDVLPLLRHQTAATGLAVVERLAVGLPKASGDEMTLQQALLGILENAVEASPDGGTLEVTTERVTMDAAEAVAVMIRDHGEGIPAERLGSVFEPFFTTKSRRSGLGLSVARKVVERHGGRVEIDSQVGAGTTVRVVLPLVKSA